MTVYFNIVFVISYNAVFIINDLSVHIVIKKTFMFHHVKGIVHPKMNTKEDNWTNVLIKQISIPMGIEICLIKTFVQLSSFVYSRTNKNIEVWNNLRVSKR